MVIIFYIAIIGVGAQLTLEGKTFLPENVCTSKSGQNFGGYKSLYTPRVYAPDLAVFTATQNLVGIHAVISMIWTFEYFARLAWKCLFTPPEQWGTSNPQNRPLPWGTWTPSNTPIPRPTPLTISNGIRIHWAILPQYTVRVRKPIKRRFQQHLVRTEILRTFHTRVEYFLGEKPPIQTNGLSARTHRRRQTDTQKWKQYIRQTWRI